MMKKACPIGVSDYAKLIQEDYYFVDKTLLIKDFLEIKNQVTLITRPRRFGKTLNMSMLSEFFDITKDSKELFIGTKIMNTPYASQMNQYPTIFMSFSGAKGKKHTIISKIKKQLLEQWSKYKFVFEHLDKYEKIQYDLLENTLMNLMSENLDGIEDALVFLMERMQAYYGKKVMVFIDEYDTPFIEAHVNHFYDDLRYELSGLLHNALKESNSLKYAMLTGIQRVAKENIFSDLNNIAVCDVTNKKYSSYFGFTESETKELLKYYCLELTEKVKAMYDGYHIGNSEIYNPWSILNYVDNGELIPYWVNTSANKMIKEAMNNASQEFNQSYEILITQGYLDTLVNLQTSFYEVSNTPNLWGLFINAGYLTVDKVIDAVYGRYRIKVPNNEVKREFESLTANYLNVDESLLYDLKAAILYEQKDLFIDKYKSILMIPSYYDLKDENSYHMMMLGMSICLNDQYDILSNREEGKGRCDIILKAKKTNQTSFVLEFKYLKENPKDIQSSLETLSNLAIQQIKDNHYDHELTGKVIYIGLAHHGKDVVIKWEEKNL